MESHTEWVIDRHDENLASVLQLLAVDVAGNVGHGAAGACSSRVSYLCLQVSSDWYRYALKAAGTPTMTW